ncbi:MAG: VWA domain-containing protein [Bryobacteraceae bacterium]|jgi:VWFA-related protein
MAPCVGVSRRNLLAALGVWPAVRLLRGQEPPTFSTGIKVVNLFATVRNRQGGIVRDLAKDDFVLKEDGRPQTIQYFSQESDLPLTLGLLVDSSGSERNMLPEESRASYRFFGQVLREDRDLAFVLHFQAQVELLQDLTSSRKLLEKGLAALAAPIAQPQQQQPAEQRGGYPGRGRGFGGTALYDAVWLACGADLMKKQEGRKALVIFSDGMDNASRVTMDEAIESAQRADTLVYSILFSDPEGGGFGGFGGRGGGRGVWDAMEGSEVLAQISRHTGGRYFEVSKRHTIEQVFDSIEEELRNLYSLGYSPDRAESATAYHKIRLTTKERSLSVQTRDGYYAM